MECLMLRLLPLSKFSDHMLGLKPNVELFRQLTTISSSVIKPEYGRNFFREQTWMWSWWRSFFVLIRASCFCTVIWLRTDYHYEMPLPYSFTWTKFTRTMGHPCRNALSCICHIHLPSVRFAHHLSHSSITRHTHLSFAAHPHPSVPGWQIHSYRLTASWRLLTAA